VPPSPTRTFGGVIEDDGCQIAQRQDDRSPWWLALVPLLVAVRRRRTN
jgi:hypothetical protein